MAVIDSRLSDYVATYGYLAVFLGSLIEGELIVFIAGFLAQQGHLTIGWIIFVAVIGGLTRDQGLFFLSRRKGMSFLKKFPNVHIKVNAQSQKISKRPFGLALFSMGFRFLYGLRGLAPIILGASDIGTFRFVITNILSTLIWACVFAGLGFGLGKLVSFFVGALAFLEILVVCAILGLGIGLRVYQLWKSNA